MRRLSGSEAVRACVCISQAATAHFFITQGKEFDLCGFPGAAQPDEQGFANVSSAWLVELKPQLQLGRVLHAA